jgi:hypothetical protein
MKKVDNYKIGETKKGDCCPECKAEWDGGDIYEYFLEAKFNPNHEQHGNYQHKTLQEVKGTAADYGWSEDDPRRFDNIIGIELPYDDPEHYDGVSYWQCPECEIAWNRFTGERTERFIRSAKASVNAKLNELREEINGEESVKEERKCIYRSLTTPDGTVLVSHHRHDYVEHEDKNGETYMLDGGLDTYRTSVNKIKGVINEVYLDEGHAKIRNFVHRGGRGKNGDQPLTWVPVSEMNDNWVSATIVYNEDRGMGDGWFNKVMKDEIEYRKEHGIVIPEEDEKAV